MIPRESLTLAIGGLLFSWLVSFPQITHGWEADVHEGLTRWLAQQAGFSQEQAEEIAKGNQEIDDNPKTAPVFLGARAILFNDRDASTILRRYHFPTNGTVPANPDQRTVKHDSDAARDSIQFVVDVPDEGRSASALKELGRALHTYQDSWSHEGTPDRPVLPLIAINPKFAWSHPCLKGGWFSHDADLTHYWREQVMGMAAGTYEFLLDYRDRRILNKDRFGTDPTILNYEIPKFAEASTKEKKEQWFQGHGFTPEQAKHFTEGLNIPDKLSPPSKIDPPQRCKGEHFEISGLLAIPTQFIRHEGPPDSSSPGVEYPSPKGFIEDFLKAWIVQRNVDNAVTYVDMHAIEDQLRPFGLQGSRNWVKRFLTMWLVEDHGLINLRGHAIVPEYYSELPLGPDEAEKQGLTIRQYESLEGAIEADDGKPYLMDYYPPSHIRGEYLDVKPTFAVLFRFKRIPRDALIVILQGDGLHTNSWRIVRLLAMVPG